MINHFKTHLANRSPEFFEHSLFPIPVDEKFVPSPWSELTAAVDRALFGDSPDPSLVDYRFFQFLRIISGCHFREHVRRFDTRETYQDDAVPPQREELFESSITPARGLTVTESPDRPATFLRAVFSVLYNAERGIAPMVFLDADRLKPARTTPITNSSCYVDRLGLTLSVSQSGSWLVDYRVRHQKDVAEIIRDVLALPEQIVFSLFHFVRDTAPEYEEGYRTITDTLSKFCMVLFAQAVANEILIGSVDTARKRISETTFETAPDTQGSFYYGASARELVRMHDVKKELQSSSVRNRRQTLEIAVPDGGHLYLCWPVRFGLPAGNRIVVDGFLNSAWSVSHAEDTQEPYVIFRSANYLRTETPIQVEIL